mmetsp:Transcript_721/g.1055  ORF Transcript_721/g.1055 Transcript_721/m.1055 type:complete len:263 (+) Transcript_721:227-1015(+)
MVGVTYNNEKILLSFFFSFLSGICCFFSFFLFLFRFKKDKGPFLSLSWAIVLSLLAVSLLLSFFFVSFLSPELNHLFKMFSFFFLGCPSLPLCGSFISSFLRFFDTVFFSTLVYCVCWTVAFSCFDSLAFTGGAEVEEEEAGVTTEEVDDCVSDTVGGVGNTEDSTGWLFICVDGATLCLPCVSGFVFEGVNVEDSFLVAVVVPRFFAPSLCLGSEEAGVALLLLGLFVVSVNFVGDAVLTFSLLFLVAAALGEEGEDSVNC